jgi:hypothetical protein
MDKESTMGWRKEETMATKPLHCSLYELCRRQIAADRAFMASKKFKTSPEVDSALIEEYRSLCFAKQ